MEEKNTEKESNKSGVKTYLIPLSEASKISGYTVEHLNLLCRKKVLKGMKVGRNWHTTQEWLNEFLFLPKQDTQGKEYKRRKRKKTTFFSEPEVNLAPESNQDQDQNQAQEDFTNIHTEENISENRIDSPAELEGGKFSWSKTIAISFSTLFISLFLFFGISFWKFLDTRNSLIGRGIPTDSSEDTFLFNENPGVVEGETTATGDAATLQGSVAASENFKINQISFGGADITLANMDNAPLGIYDVKSEAFNSKDGKQAQLLISWKTNKLSISEIEYSKDGNSNSKILQEKFYGFNHNAVLTKLDMDTAYAYKVKSRDRWGNELASEDFRAYTGSKMISVFDLILQTLNETFGWAVKKS